MKTHPFVLGLLVTLFIDAIYNKNPQTPTDVIWAIGMLLVPAAAVAMLLWGSQKSEEEEENPEDSGIDL